MDARRMVLFDIGDQRWAIDMGQLREIVVGNRRYPVPLTPHFVAGLMNLRGQIVTLIDVAACMAKNIETTSAVDTCLVLKTDEELADRGLDQQGLSLIGSDVVGLLVEEDLEMIDVSRGELQGVPAHVDGALAEYIDGIVPWGDDLVFVLNPGALLAAACRAGNGKR